MPKPSSGRSGRSSSSRTRSSQKGNSERRRKPGSKKKSKKNSGGGNPLLYVGIGGGVVTAAVVTAIIVFSGGKKDDTPAANDNGEGKQVAANGAAGNKVASNQRQPENSNPGGGNANPTPQKKAQPKRNDQNTAGNAKAGKSSPVKKKPEPKKNYPLVLSNLRVRWESLKWKMTLDYEFQQDGPDSERWYHFEIRFPTWSGIVMSPKPGTELKKKGTIELSGSPPQIRPASGELKISVREGESKKRYGKIIAAAVVTQFEAKPLTVFKTFTAAQLVNRIKTDDKSLAGKLIRVSGQLMQMKFSKYLQLDSFSNRAVVCKLDGYSKEKIPLRKTVVVEGFISKSKAKQIEIVGCLIVDSRKTIYKGKVYEAKEIASRNALVIVPLLNRRFRVKGTVLKVLNKRMLELKGVPNQSVSCEFSEPLKQAVKRGDVVVVEGAFANSDSTVTVKMIQCDLVPSQAKNKSKKKKKKKQPK